MSANVAGWSSAQGRKDQDLSFGTEDSDFEIDDEFEQEARAAEGRSSGAVAGLALGAISGLTVGIVVGFAFAKLF